MNPRIYRSTLARQGGVLRYHADPMPIPQTIAQHSWGVAALICKLHPHPSAMLLRAAIQHDLPEFVVGDMPYPVKKELGEEGMQPWKDLEQSVKRANKWIDGEDLVDDDKRWLKACDMLEVVEWCLHVAAETSSRRAIQLAAEAMDYLISMDPPGEVWDYAIRLEDP